MVDKFENMYLKDGMKIGVIGISGKGKSTLLNHLISEEASEGLKGLIGARNKETEISGQTKNPVRYFIKSKMPKSEDRCIKRFVKDEKVQCEEIKFDQVVEYATSTEKCTLEIHTKPSENFKSVMNKYKLTKLEFTDTQGLLDTLDEEVAVPPEIKECDLLLYLYDENDQGVRGDYIEKYRNFLNDISDKPLIFLETSNHWQLRRKHFQESFDQAEETLEELDTEYSISPEKIQERYSILTGNDEYKNTDTFILTSILNASSSSVNFYAVKLPSDKEDYFEACLRKCAAHTLDGAFYKLSKFHVSLEEEFRRAKSDFDYTVAFSTCYDLLYDVFVKRWQRVCGGNAKVLRHARHDYDQFINALVALNKGELFNADYKTYEKELFSPYGYYRLYETFYNQYILDCMQLLLDMYISYLQRIKTAANYGKLSKALRVHLEKSVSSDYLCRDTIYDIPALNKQDFKDSLSNLEKQIGSHSVENVVYSKFDEFDIVHGIYEDRVYDACCQHGVSPKSLITKLVYLCGCINVNISENATTNIYDKANEILKSIKFETRPCPNQ